MTMLIQFASRNPGTFFPAFMTRKISILLVLFATFLQTLSLTTFNQASLGPTGLHLRLSFCFVELVSPSCSKNLTKSFQRKPPPFITDHSLYLIKSFNPHSLVSDHPDLPSARILLGLFNQNILLFLMQPLSNFHPRTRSLAINLYLSMMYLELKPVVC